MNYLPFDLEEFIKNAKLICEDYHKLIEENKNKFVEYAEKEKEKFKLLTEKLNNQKTEELKKQALLELKVHNLEAALYYITVDNEFYKRKSQVNYVEQFLTLLKHSNCSITFNSK